MRALIDLNVILDVLLDRQPHSAASAQVLAAVETRQIDGLLCAASIDTLDYLLGKAIPDRDRRSILQTLRRLFGIATVDAAVIDAALALDWSDLEDAIVHESARLAGASLLITRNPRDFSPSPLTVLTPTEFVALQAV